MKKLTKKEINTVSGAGNWRDVVGNAVSGAITAGGIGLVTGGLAGGSAGLISGGVIGGIKGLFS